MTEQQFFERAVQLLKEGADLTNLLHDAEDTGFDPDQIAQDAVDALAWQAERAALDA